MDISMMRCPKWTYGFMGRRIAHATQPTRGVDLETRMENPCPDMVPAGVVKAAGSHPVMRSGLRCFNVAAVLSQVNTPAAQRDVGDRMPGVAKKTRSVQAIVQSVPGRASERSGDGGSSVPTPPSKRINSSPKTITSCGSWVTQTTGMSSPASNRAVSARIRPRSI